MIRGGYVSVAHMKRCFGHLPAPRNAPIAIGKDIMTAVFQIAKPAMDGIQSIVVPKMKSTSKPIRPVMVIGDNVVRKRGRIGMAVNVCRKMKRRGYIPLHFLK